MSTAPSPSPGDVTPAASAARDEYEARRRARAEEAAGLAARANLISTLRVLAFVGAIVGVGLMVWTKLPPAAWALPITLVGAFFGLVVVHAKVHDQRERAEAAVRYFDRGLARLAGEWKDAPSRGERFTLGADEHPFVDDLDIFGRGSLFQLIDATATRRGEELLAGWLSGALDAEPPERTRARQEAVRELSTKHDLREKLAVSGAMLAEGDKPDPTPFATWAAAPGAAVASLQVRLLAYVVPAVTVTTLVLGQVKIAPWWAFLAPLAVGLAVTRAFRARADAALSVASSRESALGRYGEMLARVETQHFHSAALAKLKADLESTGVSATREMARLGRIIAFVDARQNEFFKLFVSPVLLWDVHCAVALEGWRARVGNAAAGWFAALCEMEGYASLGTFAFENPRFTFPELTDDAAFEAKGLGHPLLREGKRVGNDVALRGRGTGLVVTGSNMSGKSTLLRALGTNAVLARAGAPVCAERLVLGRFVVASSMRVRDSLEDGVSRFYAELKKLKVVLDLARSPGEGRAVFFLLDEILHGTNTRERLIGARALVRELVTLGAVGAVSTHDLALGELEQELGGKVRNVHLEEQVEGDTMSFDYALRPGVVQSSNALRLMRVVGLGVELPDEPPPRGATEATNGDEQVATPGIPPVEPDAAAG